MLSSFVFPVLPSGMGLVSFSALNTKVNVAGDFGVSPTSFFTTGGSSTAKGTIYLLVILFSACSLINDYYYGSDLIVHNDDV